MAGLETGAAFLGAGALTVLAKMFGAASSSTFFATFCGLATTCRSCRAASSSSSVLIRLEGATSADAAESAPRGLLVPNRGGSPSSCLTTTSRVRVGAQSCNFFGSFVDLDGHVTLRTGGAFVESWRGTARICADSKAVIRPVRMSLLWGPVSGIEAVCTRLRGP